MAKSSIIVRQTFLSRPCRRQITTSSSGKSSTSPQRWKPVEAPAFKETLKPFAEIPGPIAMPMLRHSAHVLPRIGTFHHTVGLGLLEGLRDRYGDLVRFSKASRTRPVLFVFDPEMMREVYESGVTEPPKWNKSPLIHHRKITGGACPFHGEADEPRINYVKQQIPAEDAALRPYPLSPRFASALGEDVAPRAVLTSQRLTAALGKDAMSRPVPTSLIFSTSEHAPCCATADATPANAASYDSSPTPSLSTAADAAPDSSTDSGTTSSATLHEAPADHDSLPTPQCLAASDDTPAYPAACTLTLAGPATGARTLIGSGANELTPASSTSSDLSAPCRGAASARTFIGSGANALKPTGPTSSELTPPCRAEADTVTYLALSAGSAFTSLDCLYASFDGAVKTASLLCIMLRLVAGFQFHFWVLNHADVKDPIPPDIRTIDAAGIGDESTAIWTAIRSLLQDGSLLMCYDKIFDDIAADATRRLGDLRHAENALNEELETEVYRWALETISAVVFGIRLGCLDGDVHMPTPENRTPEKTSLEDDDSPAPCSLFKRHFDELNPAERLVRCSREIADHNYLVRSEDTLKADSQVFNNALKAFDRHYSLTEHFLQQALTKLNSGEVKPEQVFLDKLRPLEGRILPLASDALLAGVKPLAQTALSMFYQLSLHAAQQQRAHDQVLWAAEARQAGLEAPELPYITACAKEALRIHPVTGGVVRRSREELAIGGFEIPAGVDIVLAHGVTSKSEKQWARANAFIPERWCKEDWDQRDSLKASTAHPMASMPFGEACPGSGIVGKMLTSLATRVLDKYRLEWHGPAPKLVTTGVNKLVPPYYFVLQNAA